MKVFQWVRRLISVLKDFAVRSGFDKWLEEHWDDILDAVIAEVIVRLRQAGLPKPHTERFSACS